MISVPTWIPIISGGLLIIFTLLSLFNDLEIDSDSDNSKASGFGSLTESAKLIGRAKKSPLKSVLKAGLLLP